MSNNSNTESGNGCRILTVSPIDYVYELEEGENDKPSKKKNTRGPKRKHWLKEVRRFTPLNTIRI